MLFKAYKIQNIHSAVAVYIKRVILVCRNRVHNGYSQQRKVLGVYFAVAVDIADLN